MQCLCCGSPATSVAWYGDDNTRFGGGQAYVSLCGRCSAPCNHPGDPHAGYTNEEPVDPTHPEWIRAASVGKKY